MKLVRKLLRIFPFVLFLGFFVYAILSQGSFNAIDTHGINSPLMDINSFFSQCDVILKDYIKNICEFLCFGSSELNLFFNKVLCFVYNVEDVVDVWADVNGFSIFPVFLLWYELMLSFLFLFFDVFNFMIGIASNWLRKGENLNE